MNPRLRVADRRQPWTLTEGAVVVVPGNKPYRIEGLDPGSRIEIREFGDHEWRHHADADEGGALADAHGAKALATHEQGGAEYEVGVRAGGREIAFRLRIEYVHDLTQREIDIMLADLRNGGFRWDAGSPIPTRTGDLVRHAQEFERAVTGLSHDLAAVLHAPDTILEEILELVPVRRLRRMDAASARRNVREGRLAEDGTPLSRTVHAIVHRPSLDTGANAYVANAIEETRAIGRQLTEAVAEERTRLIFVHSRELKHFQGALPAERGRVFARLDSELADLERRLRGTAVPRVPESWDSLRSGPDPAANAVRFDPRYRAIHERRLNLTHGTPAEADRLQSIAAFGRRPQNDIYEYWLVAKAIETLQRMGFGGSAVDDPDGRGPNGPLRQLERSVRGSYGLEAGRPVHLAHRAVPHLGVALAYEPRIEDAQGKAFTPDIAMSLRDAQTRGRAEFEGRPYNARTLFWDAKFRSLRKGWDTFDLAAKYVDLLPGAQVHLVHLGEHEAWARRSTTDPEEPSRHFGRVGTEAVYPYRLGWSRLRPTADTEVARGMQQALVRVVFSWLVRQGVVCICPRCGGRLRAIGTGSTDSRVPFRPSGSLYPLKRQLACETCNLAMTATYCGSCRGKRMFTPILKVYPQPAAESEHLSDDWSEDFEIADRTGDYRSRVCPRCGKGFDAPGRVEAQA